MTETETCKDAWIRPPMKVGERRFIASDTGPVSGELLRHLTVCASAAGLVALVDSKVDKNNVRVYSFYLYRPARRNP